MRRNKLCTGTVSTMPIWLSWTDEPFVVPLTVRQVDYLLSVSLECGRFVCVWISRPDHPWGWWGWSLRARALIGALTTWYNKNLHSRTTLGPEISREKICGLLNLCFAKRHLDPSSRSATIHPATNQPTKNTYKAFQIALFWSGCAKIVVFT